MSQIERRKEILRLLIRDGYGSVPMLARSLDVSEMTIRRDLRALEQEGLIRRTHGGAVSSRLSQVELDYRVRLNQNVDAKKRIAKHAAALVESGDVIFLDAGTTVLAMAPYLLEHMPLTVVTHSLAVAEQMAGYEGVHLILVGGELRRDIMCLVGPLTQQSLQTFQVRYAFLGSGGIDVNRGLTHSTLEEVPVKRVAVGIAEKVIALVDSSKFGRKGIMYYLPLDEVDMIITDSDCNPEQLGQLKQNGVHVTGA